MIGMLSPSQGWHEANQRHIVAVVRARACGARATCGEGASGSWTRPVRR